MEFDVLYSCHSCDFKTHIISEMREHVKNEHKVKQRSAEDLVWHVANEWADGLCNAKIWMMNVRDGIATFNEAMLAIQKDIDHSRRVSEKTVLMIEEMKDGC